MLCPDEAREESNKDRKGREDKAYHQSIDSLLVLMWMVWSRDCKTKKKPEKKRKKSQGANWLLFVVNLVPTSDTD